MNIVGRYERVRVWNMSKGILTPPLILDLKSHKLSAYNKDAWIDFIERRYANPFRGGAEVLHNYGLFDDFPVTWGLVLANQNISPTTALLDSNYVPGTSGDAIGTTLISTIDSPITDIYFRIGSYTGTAANVNDILVEIRSYDSTNHRPLNTAPGLLDSVSVDPASATGWIKASGFNESIPVGTQYCICIGDPDGNSTDYARVNVHHNTSNLVSVRRMSIVGGAYLSTTGWTTTQTFVDNPLMYCIVHANGDVEGNSLALSTSLSSNTAERGFYLGDVPFSCTLFLVASGDIINAATVAKVYDDATNPGGTTLSTSEYVVYSNTSPIGLGFSRPFPQLEIGNAYRVVMDPAANTTLPLRHDIGTGTDANLRKARPGYGFWYQTLENAGAWADTEDGFPGLTLTISDLIEIESELETPTGQRTYPRIPVGS